MEKQSTAKYWVLCFIWLAILITLLIVYRQFFWLACQVQLLILQKLWI
jgi:hypothetical protein